MQNIAVYYFNAGNTDDSNAGADAVDYRNMIQSQRKGLKIIAFALAMVFILTVSVF